MAELDRRGVAIDRDHVAALVEASEALPAALARRDIFLLRASKSRIADVAVELATGRALRGYGTYTPPIITMQGLYPNISINGWNAGFDSEREYHRAIMGELPLEHDEPWEQDFEKRYHRLQQTTMTHEQAKAAMASRTTRPDYDR